MVSVKTTESVQILLASDEIAVRVQDLGKHITSAYTNKPLTVLGVMTGGMIFCADLVRAIDCPLQLGVVHARSYVGTESGDLTVWTETLPPIAGRHVLVLDDIFDTGRTLDRVVSELKARNPLSVQSAVLLRKSVTRDAMFEPDWVAFDIPDEFVVGYGLDFDGDYRNLPGIGVLKNDR